jgi:hypothetical protein
MNFYVIGVKNIFNISMNNNIVGVVGPSDVEVNCSYVRDPGDVLFLISLKAFSEGTYNTIATFLPTNAFPPAWISDVRTVDLYI